jgi:hypothetical protein
MTKPNPQVKAKELEERYGSKTNALIQAKQVYYMSNSHYWEVVINYLEQ